MPRRTAPAVSTPPNRPGQRWIEALRRRGELAPRTAATLSFVAGVVSVCSAAVPPFHGRLQVVSELFGSAVPSTAAGTTAAVGIALMLLSFGLRRRQRKAWVAAIVLAAVAGVLHVIKGLDVEEAALCALLLGALIASRKQFRAATAAPPARTRVMVLAGLFAVDIATGLLLVRSNEDTLEGDPHGLTRLRHVLEGFAGVRGPLHFGDDVTTNTVSAVLAGLGAITLIAAVGVLLVRPAGPIMRTPGQNAAVEGLLNTHGESDSLAWFATRDDRQVIISPSGKAAVTFRVVGGVALCAGDPLGDPEAWPGAIEMFLGECARAAWVPAVMGCSTRGATTWSRYGLDVMELGDEAVVYLNEFSLEGRNMRGVRQAVGRIERAGYTMQLRRCGDIGAEEWTELKAAATRWRQGGIERGFSMALGRLGDPREAKGVLATAHDGEGTLRAMLHFVPWGAHGLSLDVMRRDPESENGLNEALIVALLTRGGELGVERASLNFAFLRAALERGEQLGAGPIAKLYRKILVAGSRWWQIEQLYRFNAKFEPTWVPRYMCYPGTLELASVALASLRAEAFLVLPGDGKPAKAREMTSTGASSVTDR
ncbi:MAG TPA: phosphatidylglycerol lysyltransferase domain-containing protein [Sporichthyaceae bacterium]|nr:phosphatidylglycerol lysyltransferase domain-containing protein [Sporichthyaceae bacterium]